MAENSFISATEYNDEAARSFTTLAEDRPHSDLLQGVPEISTMPCGHSMNGRNLVICIDGTSNQFGERNTNVIELYNLILKEEEYNQRTWYNSGIGTYARPSWKSFKFYKQVLYHKVDLAIAWNFEQTVLGAYRWLSDNYKKGDCIFLFGFSRGAYQVRVLSAMIDKVGLIHKGNEMQIPFAYELYADPNSDRTSATQVGSQKDMSMADRFKSAFCQKDVKVHFVGAWDTVSSIGIVRGKHMLPRTVDGMTHVCYFRHALALDERRVKFLPEYAWEDSEKDPKGQESLGTPQAPKNEASKSSSQEDFEMTCKNKNTGIASQDLTGSLRKRPHTLEVWFAGTHSDIGGGNVYNTGLDRSRPPLRWMVFEAGAAGLRTAPFERELSLEEQIEIKESLTWIWWPFELIPFKRLTFTRRNGSKTTYTPHLGASRKIRHGQKIHSSLLVGKTNVPYIPKARPPDENVSFWKNLPRKWLELDLYEYTEDLVRTFVTDAVKSTHAYQTLRQIATSNDGQQALYEKVIDLFSSGTLTLEAKCRLLRFSLDILDNHQLILKPSMNIRPFLMDLPVNGYEAYHAAVKEFLVSFTDPLIRVLQGPKFKLMSAGFLPNSGYIYSSWYDNGVRIWEVETGKQLKVIQELNDSASIAKCSPDGKCVALILGSRTSCYSLIRIWDLNTGRAIGKPFGQHKGYFYSIDFSPDGRLLVSCSSDMTIRVWDVQTQEQIKSPFVKYVCATQSVSFSPNGRYLVAGLDNGIIQVWDVEQGKQTGDSLRGHRDSIFSAKFSPDGRYIVSGSMDKTVRIWDVATGTTVGVPFEGHTFGICDAVFSPDGKYVASASMDRTVRVWNATTGNQIREPLQGHTGWVRSVSFSHDGAYLMSGSEDGTIRIWDANALETII